MFKKSKKEYYYWEEVSKIDGLVHGISTRHFGSIKNKRQINKENLKSFLYALGIDNKKTVFPEQVHGSGVVVISSSLSILRAEGPTNVEGSHTTSIGERDSSTPNKSGLGMTEGAKLVHIPKADGLITSRKNVFLGVVTADCLPVIFYDKKSEIVGIVHAGYKGILKGILKNMVLSFKKLGSDTKNILVAIGPSIGVCCYDVSIERVEMFVNAFEGIKTHKIRNGKYFLDLKNIAKQSLISEGVSENNIEVSNICTKDYIKDFFSFRGEGRIVGEFVTIVGRI